MRDLEIHVNTQQAKLEGVQQALAASRREAASAADRVMVIQVEIGALRGDLLVRAVEAYVRHDDQRIDSLFTSDNVTVAAHKRALLDTIVSNEVDLVDRLRAGEDLLSDLRDEANAAVERVVEEEAVEAVILSDLEGALANERRLKDALEARIAEVQNEVDALQADEARLTSLITSLIAEEEARKAAEQEARRRAEEQRRLAEEAARNPQVDVPTPIPLPAPESSRDLAWPSSGIVTSSFGLRWGRMHNGIDIAAGVGTPVSAAQAGTVISAEFYGGFGNMVVIDHGAGFTTVYAHLDQIHVAAGLSVSQGTSIGIMGCTGSCTGPHVHFETRVNGIPQDPLLLL